MRTSVRVTSPPDTKTMRESTERIESFIFCRRSPLNSQNSALEVLSKLDLYRKFRLFHRFREWFFMYLYRFLVGFWRASERLCGAYCHYGETIKEGPENHIIFLTRKSWILISESVFSWGLLAMIWVISRCMFIQTASQLVWKASGTLLTPCLWLGVMLRCHNDLIARSDQKSAVCIPLT